MNGKILYVRGLSDAARQVLEREAEQAHHSLSAWIVKILEQYTMSPSGKTMAEMQTRIRGQQLDTEVSHS